MTQILLVDDEPAHRLIERRAVCAALPGATIHECASAEDLINFFRSKSCDLLVLDVNLNGTSGVDVLIEVKKSFPKDMPVLLISTSQLDADVQAGYAAGANTYIYKSEDPQVFRTNLGKACLFLLGKVE